MVVAFNNKVFLLTFLIKSGKRIMQRVERHIILNNPEIDHICFLSKNLYNFANYHVRQEFFNNKKWLRYQDLDKLLKNSSDYKLLPAQALVYRDSDYNWKTSIRNNSYEGFSEHIKDTGVEYLFPNNGTEVCAYIDKKKTSPDLVKNFIFQFLGMVDNSNGRVLLDSVHINSLRETYSTAPGIPVWINDIIGDLTMGVSKRALSHNWEYENQFKFRDQNLHQIVYTQRGLFIKYDESPFDSQTIHGMLLKDMTKMGLDFWVDVPQNVTLTKGRNNVIADHSNLMEDAMYRGFENLFIDVLLEDEDVIDHSSNTLLNSISVLFDIGYEGEIRAVQTGRYPLKRRFFSFIGKVGSSLIDFMKSVVGSTAEAASTLWKMSNEPMSLPLLDILGHFKNLLLTSLPKKETAIKILGISLGFLPLMLAGLYGLNKLCTLLSWKFTYVLAAPVALAVLGFVLVILIRKCSEIIASAWAFANKDISFPKFNFNFLKNIDLRIKLDFGLLEKLSLKNTFKFSTGGIKEIFRVSGLIVIAFFLLLKKGAVKTVEGTTGLIRFLMGFSGFYLKKATLFCLRLCGLYENMEERKEKKRIKIRKKISKKYLCGMHKNKFFKRIMSKKIIPADIYYSPNDNSIRESVNDTLKGMFNEVREAFSWIGLGKNTEVRPAYYYKPNYGTVLKKKIRISIDDMIDLYLQKRLIYTENKQKTTGYFLSGYTATNTRSSGDVVVNEKNPLVITVMGRMDKISYDVKERYNVKLIEDHLENIMKFFLGLFSFVFFASYITLLFMSPLIFFISILPNDVGYSGGYYNNYSYDPMSEETLNFFKRVSVIANIVFFQFVFSVVFRSKNPFKDFKFYKRTMKLFSFFAKLPKKIFSRKKSTKEVRLKNKGSKKEIIVGIIRSFQDMYRRAHSHGPSILHFFKGVFIEAWKILQPISKALNPLRYPRYIGIVLIFLYKLIHSYIKEKIEDIKFNYTNNKEKKEKRKEALKEKKEERLKRKAEEVERKKEMKKVFIKKNKMLGRFYSSWLAWYSSSWINHVFGYTMRDGREMKKLTRSKLKSIIKNTGVGQSYLDFMNVAEMVDELVSKVLDIKPLTLCYSYSKSTTIGWATDNKQFFGYYKQDKQKHFYLPLEMDYSIYTPIHKTMLFTHKEKEDYLIYNRALLQVYTIRILDYVLHIKSHQIKECSLKVHSNDHKNFLRRKVVDYLRENNIDLVEKVKGLLTEVDIDADVFYHIMPEELSALSNMTIRRLKHECLVYSTLVGKKVLERVDYKKEKERIRIMRGKQDNRQQIVTEKLNEKNNF